jgi:hypothetical protein
VSELYNDGAGLEVHAQPSGITESTDVLYNFCNCESGGTYLINEASLGIGKNLTLVGSPEFSNGPIGRGSNGVFLPSFEYTVPGTVGNSRSIRFEMNHNWKIGTPIDVHMHVSVNETILSGQTIIFNLEYTNQDIYAVLSTSSLNVLNPSKTFPFTSAITYTFTAYQDIPAYSNLILSFSEIDMSQYTSVSVCGIMTITRLTGTFTGPIFEVQSVRMHYEIDSTGSRSKYSK